MNETRQIDYDSVGTDESHVAVAPAELSATLDDALELQPISIRLQKDLLDNLKAATRQARAKLTAAPGWEVIGNP